VHGEIPKHRVPWGLLAIAGWAILGPLAFASAQEPSLKNVDRVDVGLLHDNLAALEIRLSLARNACCSINIVSFEVHDDDTTGQVMAELLAARQRGVRVRLLTDGHLGGNAIPKALMSYLIGQGIEIRERPVDVRYQVEVGRPRLHDKLWIVDQEHLVIGGRNLTQRYFGLGSQVAVDRDLYVRGAVATQASQYFESRWSECIAGQPSLTRVERPRIQNRQSHPQWDGQAGSQADCQIVHWLDAVRQHPLLARSWGCAMDFPIQSVSNEHIQLLHDSVGKNKSACTAIAARVHRILNHARHSIDIETPYLVVTQTMRQILVAAAKRGVRVRILTNSLETTDKRIVHAGYANQRRWMLRSGIELYEFRGQDFLHAKAMIVDGRLAMVGSYNFDVLSENRNSEVAVLVSDFAFAEQLQRSFQSHLCHSGQIELRGLAGLEARENRDTPDALRQYRLLRLPALIAKPFL
jgi:putative cardiolipin synthase